MIVDQLKPGDSVILCASDGVHIKEAVCEYVGSNVEGFAVRNRVADMWVRWNALNYWMTDLSGEPIVRRIVLPTLAGDPPDPE